MYYDQKKIAKLCPSQRQIAAMEDWVQEQSERIQRRFARFKAQVEHYWKLYPWLMCTIFVFASCRSQQIIVPNDTITKTQTQTKTIQRDSIFLHDSIYVREYTKGDTIFIDKIVEHFKDRWQTKIDTFARCDTITITQTQTIKEPVRYVPNFYKWCTGIFWIMILMAIIMVVIKFVK